MGPRTRKRSRRKQACHFMSTNAASMPWKEITSVPEHRSVLRGGRSRGTSTKIRWCAENSGARASRLLQRVAGLDQSRTSSVHTRAGTGSIVARKDTPGGAAKAATSCVTLLSAGARPFSPRVLALLLLVVLQAQQQVLGAPHASKRRRDGLGRSARQARRGRAGSEGKGGGGRCGE